LRRRALLGAAAATALLGAAVPARALIRKTPAVPASGATHPELSAFDELMAEFVADRRVPGAALAITRAGRLVYARGFGIADLERGETVQPASLFRLASVSKPFTAVAVLQLAERGRLDLDAGAWALLGLAEPRDPRWKRVTVRHLLQHTGGWDRAAGFDPMFSHARVASALGVSLPLEAGDFIRYMLGQPLDFEPGSREAYSGFGYCLLGRVVERASGLAYGEYVRRELLAPLGIRRMRLGRTLREDRQPGEVAYYDEQGRVGPAVVGAIGAPAPLPYGRWALESMDAHAGWLGSAVDLARFAAAFDSPAACKVLGADAIATMFARPDGPAGYEADGQPRAAYYGCGWRVRPFGRLGQSHSWHNGSMAGSAALVARGYDGTNWAAAFNTRSGPDGALLDVEIERLLHRAARSVREWPALDRFSELL